MDAALTGKSLSLLYPVSFILVASFVLKAYLDVVKSKLSVSLAEGIALDFKSLIFEKILTQPLLVLESKPSSDYLTYFTRDIDAIKRFLGYLFLDFLYSLILVSFIWLLLLKWVPDLACLCLVFMLTPILIYAKWGTSLRKDYEKLKNLENASWRRIPEILKGIRTIRVFNQEARETHGFLEKQDTLLKASVETYSKDGLVWAVASLLASVFMVVLLVLSLEKVSHGKMTVGALAAVNACFVMLFLPLIKMALLNSHWQDARISYQRLSDFLRNAPSPNRSQEEVIDGAVSPAEPLVFKNVSFGYDKKNPILKEINFSLRAGQKAAIVGVSGSGKTTLVLLIARLLQPDLGSIHRSAKEKCAFVLQDDFLFEGTIRDNIICGRKEMEGSAIFELAKETGLFDFITDLPEGLDTMITENFTNISFGQRQKIALARALLMDPEILILDEPTSFLDPISEQALLDLLFRIKSTVVMISHRIASIRDMDKIIVLDQGRVAGEGAHEELIATNRVYQMICSRQVESTQDAGVS